MSSDAARERDAAGWLGLPAHRDWLAAESERVLTFAEASRVPGGFAALDDDGRPDPSQPLQLWITARMTHVFALGQLMGRPGCGPLVEHGVAALRGPFQDEEHGGWYADVEDGRPATASKTAYEHAFVLLAASSAVQADADGAGALLADATRVIAERFWSEEDGLSVEEWDRGWTALDGYRGANANMHMTEACLAAGDATGDHAWYGRALRIAERLIHGIARAHGWRLPEHFDAAWRPQQDYNRDQP